MVFVVVLMDFWLSSGSVERLSSSGSVGVLNGYS